VATDIAARGIHVDDVSLVVHADPPAEHKAYLHRSGRTARAGAEGTVVTVMLDSQVADVRDLTRRAGIKPTITRAGHGHPVLAEIAPGERTFGEPVRAARPGSQPGNREDGGSRAGSPGGGRRRGRGKGRQGSGSSTRSGAAPTSGSRESAGRSRNGSRGGRAASATAPSGSHSAAAFSASRRGR
jgi:superfamily II DNA/RNA helicase